MIFERHPTNHKASDGATRSFPDTKDLLSPDFGDLDRDLRRFYMWRGTSGNSRTSVC